MQRLFERHRDAEAARDYDAILATFVEDCFSTPILSACAAREGSRRGRPMRGTSLPFPIWRPMTRGVPSARTSWWSGALFRAAAEESGWACPRRAEPSKSRSPTSPPSATGRSGEAIYFDLATLCEQAAQSLDKVRAGARNEQRRCARRARKPKPSKPPGCRSRRCRRRTWSWFARSWRRGIAATTRG